MVMKTRTTLAEFLALPEQKPYLELMDGEVIEKAMPNRTHGRVVARLIQILGNYLDASGEGTVETEVRHHERHDDWVFLPDISVTLRSRTSTDPQMTGLVSTLPDLAIEVLSPDDRPGRLHRRIEHYMHAGVPLVWIIDPEEEQVTVWRPAEPMTSYSAPQQLTARPVLESFTLDLSDLFERTRA